MQVQGIIARRKFIFDRARVERILRRELPEPLDEHYVVVRGRRFPPKQVISLVTGLDRADFNTHQARRVLGRLGFTVGRRSLPGRDGVRAGRATVGPHGGREAEALRPFVGQWVAQRDLEVLVAARTPEAVLAWLERHGVRADAMFRVPEDEAAGAGLAPA
jgi:hypothetical protein